MRASVERAGGQSLCSGDSLLIAFNVRSFSQDLAPVAVIEPPPTPQR